MLYGSDSAIFDDDLPVLCFFWRLEVAGKLAVSPHRKKRVIFFD
jgi:hypothetical protein